MTTFPRGFVNHQLNVANAQRIAQLTAETGARLEQARASSPVDLRGIPAIGPNVAGAIPGTTPHHATLG